MATNTNEREETSTTSRKSLATNRRAEKCHRCWRILYGKAALTLAFLPCLVLGGVRAHTQTYSVLISFSGETGGWPTAGLITDPAGNLYGTTEEGGTADMGTVFKLDRSGNKTLLHSFSGGDGAFPGGLIMDRSGNLYGITGWIAPSGDGAAFKLDPSGKETVLHTFGVSEPGPNGLVMDASGNLYGTTSEGGAAGWGTAFKLDPSGNETLLYSFWSYDGDGAYPLAGLTMDSSGNFYGTTAAGGADGVYGGGTVFKLDPSGNETVLHSFASSFCGDPGSDGADPQDRPIMDPSGNLYGVTECGGAAGMGTVFKLDRSGNETVLHSFGLDSGDGEFPIAALMMDASGNLYGTTMAGGTAGGGTVFKIDTSGNETVLHSFGLDNGDGELPLADLVMDAWGNLYGTTFHGGSSGAGTIFKLTFSVPFSAFDVKLDIRSEPRPGYQLKANFSQGAGGPAIDPLSQPLSLTVGTYTVTIPPGSFRALKHGAYVYEGTIDGTTFEVRILQTGTDSYQVQVEASGADVTASPNPVPVKLSIGRNTGATEVDCPLLATRDHSERGWLCENHGVPRR